jgi:hypothetical protein
LLQNVTLWTSEKRLLESWPAEHLEQIYHLAGILLFGWPQKPTGARRASLANPAKDGVPTNPTPVSNQLVCRTWQAAAPRADSFHLARLSTIC